MANKILTTFPQTISYAQPLLYCGKILFLHRVNSLSLHFMNSFDLGSVINDDIFFLIVILYQYFLVLIYKSVLECNSPMTDTVNPYWSFYLFLVQSCFPSYTIHGLKHMYRDKLRQWLDREYFLKTPTYFLFGACGQKQILQVCVRVYFNMVRK